MKNVNLFDKSNSPAGSHCIDLLDFEDSQASQPSLPPKSSKNSTSTTSCARIVDSSTQTDSSLAESSLDKNPQDSRGNLTQNDKTNSPSLAEGVRGWVKITSFSLPKSYHRFYFSVLKAR